MKRVLVLQHMDRDSPGRFSDFFRADGFSVDTVLLHRGEMIPALGHHDLMFVLGGPMDTWEEAAYPWLVAEKQAIREWAGDRAKPFIGMCLGHQLLAEALGGRIGISAAEEIGVIDIEFRPEASRHWLTAGLSGVSKVAAWHHAEVMELPPGAVSLASSATTAVQIMAVDNHAVGTQFHAEWTSVFIDEWRDDPVYMTALAKALGPSAYPRVRAELHAIMGDYHPLGRRVYDNLMSAVGLVRVS
jgi:GMP synthase-like glutamine amidotransferase